MKGFFSKHSYSMVKMFLNQFATSIFGLVLAIATIKAGNRPLAYATSAAAILFYLFLLYTMTWELGFKDRGAVENGRAKKNLWQGTLISLCANIPNFLFAIFIMLGSLLDVSFISSISGVCAFLTQLLEGMYTGLLTIRIGGAALNSYWAVYFLLPIPAIIISTVAYIMGLKDIKFTPLFDPVVPESDREQKKKR